MYLTCQMELSKDLKQVTFQILTELSLIIFQETYPKLRLKTRNLNLYYLLRYCSTVQSVQTKQTQHSLQIFRKEPLIGFDWR